MRFVTWCTEDELSVAPTAEERKAGGILNALLPVALDRGHERVADGDDNGDFWLAVNGPSAAGEHLEVPDDQATFFHLMLGLRGSENLVAWRAGGKVIRTTVGFRWSDQFLAFLDALDERTGSDRADVGVLLEAFVALWRQAADNLELDVEDRRIGDALADLFGELSKAETPPRGVIRSALDWFRPRLDRFTDEFASAAGKTLGTTAGTAVGVGIAYGASRVPELRHVAAAIFRHVAGTEQ